MISLVWIGIPGCRISAAYQQLKLMFRVWWRLMKCMHTEVFLDVGFFKFIFYSFFRCRISQGAPIEIKSSSNSFYNRGRRKWNKFLKNLAYPQLHHSRESKPLTADVVNMPELTSMKQTWGNVDINAANVTGMKDAVCLGKQNPLGRMQQSGPSGLCLRE